MQMVVKTIPTCGHKLKLPCKVTPEASMCNSKCERQLSCGHPCLNVCGQPCDENNCNQLRNDKLFDSPCGHKIMLPCKFYKDAESLNVINDTSAIDSLLKYCKEPCRAQLACGHACAGSCAACWQGRLHEPCAQRCDKPLICGHTCKEPCNEICPPCEKPCAVKCQHSTCKNKCGTPCSICKENCERKCSHGSCTRLCGVNCSIPPCSEPCPKRLKCSHPCRGVCSNPCPDVCKICDPDSFPKDLAGYEYEDDAKLILLEDCGHIMDVDDLDNWMNSKMETVGVKLCPLCRTPIITTYRYKNLINNMLKNEINPIKEQLYGKPNEIKVALKELRDKVDNFGADHSMIMKDLGDWRKAFEKLRKYIKDNRKPSLLQIKFNLLYLNILEMLSENYVQYMREERDKNPHLPNLMKQIKMLCSVLSKNVKKISNQLQQDIHNEMQRLHAIVQLDKIAGNPSYLSIRNKPEICIRYKEAKDSVFNLQKFNANDTMQCLTRFQDAVKLNVITTKEEKDLIVQALGLKAGHWFKCPNGHFYCIGECGGAMETSTCPECGATIGGRNHTLDPSNALAPEMDGARFAAWSEEYNNMRNFDF